MVPKRKLTLPYYDGLVDVYLDGKKVYCGHNGRRAHIYFHLSEDENPKVEVAPNDKRIGIEAEIKDGKAVPFVIERKMIKDVVIDEVDIKQSRNDVPVVTAGVDVTSKGVTVDGPSNEAQEVMREIKRESRRRTFDLGKMEKSEKLIAKELEAESNVGFSQEATVEVTRKPKLLKKPEPKSLEDYGS